DPRRALGPAAKSATQTGRTRDRTRPMLQQRQKVLAKAPSTRDPKRTWRLLGRMGTLSQERSSGGTVSAMEPRGNQAQRALSLSVSWVVTRIIYDCIRSSVGLVWRRINRISFSTIDAVKRAHRRGQRHTGRRPGDVRG